MLGCWLPVGSADCLPCTVQEGRQCIVVSVQQRAGGATAALQFLYYLTSCLSVHIAVGLSRLLFVCLHHHVQPTLRPLLA
jgi:hypothetical protein